MVGALTQEETLSNSIDAFLHLMKVFVYEFVMGGGLLINPSLRPVARGLAIEGFSMLRSVVEDFAGFGCNVSVLRDVTAWKLIDATIDATIEFPVEIVDVSNATEAEQLISEQSRAADSTLVIAPEIDGHLLQIVRRLEDTGVKLLSPSSPFIEIAADKLRTSETLEEHGCPTIKSQIFDVVVARELLLTESPIVIKPRLGAGSGGIRIIRNVNDLRDLESLCDDHFLMQPLVNGTAISVSAICCGESIQPFPACYQHFDQNSESPFEYQGGSLPIANELQERASQLAILAIKSLPPTIGICGVDIMLGADVGGTEDFVVEINPRLTTSYLVLRKACNGNLASAMLAAATGKTANLTFSEDRFAFSCSENTDIDSNIDSSAEPERPATISRSNP